MAELKTNLDDDTTDSEPEYTQYKCILLGDGAVGKTSLATRFTEDHFGKNYKQTIGLDFMVKRLVLPGDVHVCLQIWDIGGQSIGGKMIGKYIHGAHVVLLCYDITNYQSWQNLEDWYGLVKSSIAPSATPYICLVGTKSDLNHLRAVKLDKHNAFAEANDMYSFFVSSKSGDNVQPMFYRMAADLSGVKLTKPELEIKQKVVSAEIVNHPQNDPSLPEAKAKTEPRGGKKKKSGCVLM